MSASPDTTVDTQTTPTAPSEAPAPRTGSALVRATFPYRDEDLRRSWMELFSTIVVIAALVTGIVVLDIVVVKLFLGVLLGLTWVRAFILFHDTRHGALFKKSPLGRRICDVFGMLSLSPPSVWSETHDYHHRNNAKMVGASIGSFPIVTTTMWRRMSSSQRWMYWFVRSPINIAAAYFTVFTIGMCLSPARRNFALHGPWAIATLVTHYGLIAALWYFGGFWLAFHLMIFPFTIAGMSGAYLFYAQHNFPGGVVYERREWNYHAAALRSSSMFHMSPLMHWFTGEIGYHHVHHLNHQVPFYRLSEAMDGIPELQDVGVTSWHPRDVLACLNLAVWDSRGKRWKTWSELRSAA